MQCHNGTYSAGVVTVEDALVGVVVAEALPFEVPDVDVVAGGPDDDGALTLTPPPAEDEAVPIVMAAAVVRGEGGEERDAGVVTLVGGEPTRLAKN